MDLLVRIAGALNVDSAICPHLSVIWWDESRILTTPFLSDTIGILMGAPCGGVKCKVSECAVYEEDDGNANMKH